MVERARGGAVGELALPGGGVGGVGDGDAGEGSGVDVDGDGGSCFAVAGLGGVAAAGDEGVFALGAALGGGEPVV